MSNSVRRRDAEATKTKIVDSAMALFSKKGFDATTVDDIAEAGGVNKALLYYYFDSKAGLYSEVMTRVLDAIGAEVLAANARCGDPLCELEAFITAYAVHAVRNPYFPALLLRELSDSGAHLPDMMFEKMRQLFALLRRILARGEAEGLFHDVVPMVVHFMIIGTLNLLVTTQPLREAAERHDPNAQTCSDCPVEEIAAYLYRKIRRMLEES